jgi:hypothetical protein
MSIWLSDRGKEKKYSVPKQHALNMYGGVEVVAVLAPRWKPLYSRSPFGLVGFGNMEGAAV